LGVCFGRDKVVLHPEEQKISRFVIIVQNAFYGLHHAFKEVEVVVAALESLGASKGKGKGKTLNLGAAFFGKGPAVPDGLKGLGTRRLWARRVVLPLRLSRWVAHEP
jgi:hypothetical protein